EVRRAGEQVVGAGLDLLDRGGNVERGSDEVAGVRDLLHAEGLDVECRIVGPQQPGGLAHRGRSEPGARAERRAGVERNPRDGDVASLDTFDERETREGGE